MNDLILHHYELSHFAEKIRRVLAYKKVAWRGVEQPFMMPKPELVPLTGGVRRIPVLQIGADIYCDTALIARKIEELAPSPSVIPAGQAAIISIIEAWAGRQLMFQTLLPTFAAMLPVLPPEFVEDRARMSEGLSREAIVAGAPHSHAQMLLSLDYLNAQLATQPFLLGTDFTLADAACFFPLWLFREIPDLHASVTARPAIAKWYARIVGFGQGNMQPMAAAEALDVALHASPSEVPPDGLEGWRDVRLGDAVAISADDYGVEETRGIITHITDGRIAILRSDPKLGDIAVHFPLAGYRLRKA